MFALNLPHDIDHKNLVVSLMMYKNQGTVEDINMCSDFNLY